MIKFNNKQLKLIRDHLCDDLDAESCKELIELLQNSNEHRIYFDTVKKTVKLCKDHECPEDLPDDINERLFHALGIDKEKCKDKK
jgi:hypothetical protein